MSETKNLRTETLAIAAFAMCSVAAAVTSKGFLEADGCTHYLFAHFAFQQPIYFVDVWGRPLCTALFALPAHLVGLIGVRMVSLCLAIACGLVARAIAVGRNDRWPALALIFTLGQPLLFLHSFAELTELPFALILGLIVLTYERQRWLLLTMLAAIAPLARPEGFALLVPVSVVLLLHRQWKSLLILPLGLFAWSLTGHLITGPADAPWWRWLIDHWPYGARSEYARGSLLHFLALLPMIVGPFALPAMWIGMARGLGQARHIAKLQQDHRARVDALIALVPLGVLIGHSVLYWGGWFASNGELRYLLIAAPMWGLLSARGWTWIFERMNWQRPIAWAALAVVAPGLVNYAWRVLPLGESADWLAAKQCAQWYESSPIRRDYPRILCNHPAVFYFLDRCPLDERFVAAWSGKNIDSPPPGTLLMWDPVYSVYNADPRAVMRLDRIRAAGWILDSRAEMQSTVNSMSSEMEFSKQWHIFRSPQSAVSLPTADAGGRF